MCGMGIEMFKQKFVENERKRKNTCVCVCRASLSCFFFNAENRTVTKIEFVSIVVGILLPKCAPLLFFFFFSKTKGLLYF